MVIIIIIQLKQRKNAAKFFICLNKEIYDENIHYINKIYNKI